MRHASPRLPLLLAAVGFVILAPALAHFTAAGKSVQAAAVSSSHRGVAIDPIVCTVAASATSHLAGRGVAIDPIGVA